MVDVLENRILPAFEGIDGEAEAAADAAWEEFMSSPGTGEEDPADYAETAVQAGVSHYILLHNLRQGIVNLFAAALYHLYEQQAMTFLRTEILDPREGADPSFFKVEVLQARLVKIGIDVAAFPSWPTIDELRLVANTVKHAAGASARALRARRPDLFENPLLGKLSSFPNAQTRSAFLPLAGEDVYLLLADIQKYRDTVLAFWRELREETGPG